MANIHQDQIVRKKRWRLQIHILVGKSGRQGIPLQLHNFGQLFHMVLGQLQGKFHNTPDAVILQMHEEVADSAHGHGVGHVGSPNVGYLGSG
ncbi:hypothetical protein D3C76_1506230 [compost metagenome]